MTNPIFDACEFDQFDLEPELDAIELADLGDLDESCDLDYVRDFDEEDEDLREVDNGDPEYDYENEMFEADAEAWHSQYDD